MDVNTGDFLAKGFLGKILAPVEFSERCIGAVRYANALAEHLDSEIVLLHVLPPQPAEMDEQTYRDRAAEAEQKLHGFLADELAGASVRRLVIKGDPARKIVQYAQNEHADIILMPTHGFGPFRRFLLGSNTAKVLHDADCPVWTGIHIDEAPVRIELPIRNILCAVDLGPQSGKALAWAIALQKQFSARLTMVHATPVLAASARGTEASWNASVEDAAEKELERLREEADANADTLVEAGEPAPAICSAAHRLSADVLVIARGSASGVYGRLRANAYEIIRLSPCPVVSV